jgi:putative ABC transport system permease protein
VESRGDAMSTLKAGHGLNTLAHWLLGAQWRSHRGRALVAMLTIALGVGLGYAVYLINGAAFNEFSAAARSLSGQADLQVRGVQPFMDETIYPRLATHAGVVAASPVLEVDLAVPGKSTTLKVLGMDAFRARRMTPDLAGVPSSQAMLDVLADDAVFLSPAAKVWLGMQDGSHVTLQGGTSPVTLRVAGGILRARPGQRVGVMDIAAVQTHFHMLGKLSRVDLQLARGVDSNAFRQELQRELGTHLVVDEPSDVESRTDRLSRAYRINMNVLALMALFTGAFLVFATQAAGVMRLRAQLAMLRVLGMTRAALVRQILLEGGLLGLGGGVLGIALGFMCAALALRVFDGDLGGGYFPGVEPHVAFEPIASAAFLVLGVGVALAGSLVPALEAARAQPAPALKAGSEEVALAPLGTPWPALVCLVVGLALAPAPSINGVPVAGYVAMAFLLMGAIALMPRLTATVFRWASARRVARQGHVVTMLALARVANAPGQASIAMGGVLSSFALIVAMAIMVASFRVSVEHWLEHLLSADIYGRVAQGGDAVGLRPDQQTQVAAVGGIAHVAFARVSRLTLDTARPPVALIARELDAADPNATLQMTGHVLQPASWRSSEIPVWASEAMVDLYGYRVGQRLQLPIGGAAEHFVVAGIWRDYVRQTGALQMRVADYRRLTGDVSATDMSITLRAGATAPQVIRTLKRLPFGDALELSQPGEIRARTLTTFDRAFAVTYLLEAVAMVIGLFGVGATFSIQALARANEFGMLRHVGVTTRQILAMIASEAGWLTLLGIAMGCALGFAISLILVYVVNPQSFHWSISLHVPWVEILVIGCVMLVSSCVTAVLAGLRAVSMDAVRAVREDW